MWVRVGVDVIGTLYHPPRTQYIAEALIDYIEACIQEIVQSFRQALIILTGDFNQLSTNLLCERMHGSQVVSTPVDPRSDPRLIRSQSTVRSMSWRHSSAATTRLSWHLARQFDVLQTELQPNEHTARDRRLNMIRSFNTSPWKQWIILAHLLSGKLNLIYYM